jgi:hypothetical protein
VTVDGKPAIVEYEPDADLRDTEQVPLRSLEEIAADILAVEKEAEGLLDGLLKSGAQP